VNAVNITARAIAEATAPAPSLVVQHLAKSYEVSGRMVPVIGDLSLTLDNSKRICCSRGVPRSAT
jgi:NitT/TauT family transport system ATP-binding protein